MRSVFGFPAGTAPRHGRFWYWRKRSLYRLRPGKGVLVAGALALGVICVGQAGKIAATAVGVQAERRAIADQADRADRLAARAAVVPARDGAAPRTASKDAAAPAISAPAPEAKERVAARPAVQPAPQLSATPSSGTDGRAARPDDPVSPVVEARPAQPAEGNPESAVASAPSNPDPQTAVGPPQRTAAVKSGGHKSKPRHVASRHREWWDRGGHSSRMGFASRTSALPFW